MMVRGRCASIRQAQINTLLTCITRVLTWPRSDAAACWSAVDKGSEMMADFGHVVRPLLDERSGRHVEAVDFLSACSNIVDEAEGSVPDDSDEAAEASDSRLPSRLSRQQRRRKAATKQLREEWILVDESKGAVLQRSAQGPRRADCACATRGRGQRNGRIEAA